MVQLPCTRANIIVSKCSWPSWISTTTQCDSAPPSPPPLPPAPPAADSITEAIQSVSSVPNPGAFENANMDTRRIVSPDTYDGFRIDINKQLNPFMAAVHTFWLGTGMIPDGRNYSYTFLTQVANEKGVLMARVDPLRKSVECRINSNVVPVRLQVGASADGQNDQAFLDLDLGLDTWMANFKYGSAGGGPMWGCNFFQSITPRLAMGGEGMYIAANQSFPTSYTVKYTWPAASGEEDAPFEAAATPSKPSSATTATAASPPTLELKGSSTMCANFNTMQSLLTLSYRRVVTPQRVTLAAELQCNPLTLDSQVVLGAEFKLMRSRMTMAVDGTGRMQSLLETKLGSGHGSPSLNFAGEVDHGKNLMRFGYGISFDG